MTNFKKLTNGTIIIIIGVLHSVLTPVFYAKQFQGFAEQFFFKVNNGFMESQVNYETFAAFWCLFFGLMLLPLGVLLHTVEKRISIVPMPFILTYLIVVLIGVYMIPLGGITFLMLPHVVYMLLKYRKAPGK